MIVDWREALAAGESFTVAGGKIALDGLGNIFGASRAVLSGDVRLIAEHALVRASGMGDEEGDDHENQSKARSLAPQLLQRFLRGLLLRVLLAPADAPAADFAPDEYLDGKLLLVVRTRFGNNTVFRELSETFLAEFLELGLVIERTARGAALLDGLVEK